MQQSKVSLSSYFLTLTYDTSHVPITQAGYMSLFKKHLQLFFKRVRKAHECVYGDGYQIKYYAVGEYGGKSLRPHYHVIIFNCKLELMVGPNDLVALRAFRFDGKHPVKCVQWDHGHMTVGSVSPASVGYCMKYVCKPTRIPMHRNDDRLKEFAVMSKGLGVSYLTDAIHKWHHDDLENRMYLTVEGGVKCSMPRYYKQKLYHENEKAIIARAAEIKFATEFFEKQECLLAPDGYQKWKKAIQAALESAYRVMYRNCLKGQKL